MKFLVVLVFMVLSGSFQLSMAGEGHVGEIRYSILTLSQFQAIYGVEWEMMKGQAIPVDSELLPLWGNSHVPDARGIFLRGYNDGRDLGTGNPGGDLPVGTLQRDGFKRHSHSFRYLATGFNQCFRCAGPFAISILQDDPHPRNATFTTDLDGGGETRPRSLIVNTFIKMKESPAPAPAPAFQVTPEMIHELRDHPVFREAIEGIIRDMMNR